MTLNRGGGPGGGLAAGISGREHATVHTHAPLAISCRAVGVSSRALNRRSATCLPTCSRCIAERSGQGAMPHPCHTMPQTDQIQRQATRGQNALLAGETRIRRSQRSLGDRAHNPKVAGSNPAAAMNVLLATCSLQTDHVLTTRQRRTPPNVEM